MSKPDNTIRPILKLKMKKNANEYVDYEQEKKTDPKYKTEMCKSWADTSFCVYGNKCRFAHGKQELSCRIGTSIKYKQRECKSFYETGICMYGSRCSFKHDERNILGLNRSYYSYAVNSLCKPSGAVRPRRLKVFEGIAKDEGCLVLPYSKNGFSDCFNYGMTVHNQNYFRMFIMNRLS